jgi:hypothetical protein
MLIRPGEVTSDIETYQTLCKETVPEGRNVTGSLLQQLSTLTRSKDGDLNTIW